MIQIKNLEITEKRCKKVSFFKDNKNNKAICNLNSNIKIFLKNKIKNLNQIPNNITK